MTACGNWKKNACVVSKNRLLQLMYFAAFSFLYYYFPFAITKNTFTELHHEYIRCHIRNRKCLPLVSHGFTLVVLWGHMGSRWLFCGVRIVHLFSFLCCVFRFVFVLSNISNVTYVSEMSILGCHFWFL